MHSVHNRVQGICLAVLAYSLSFSEERVTGPRAGGSQGRSSTSDAFEVFRHAWKYSWMRELTGLGNQNSWATLLNIGLLDYV